MDYQEQLQHAIKKTKKVAIYSTAIMIFIVIIFGIIGKLGKEDRAEKLVEGLNGKSYMRSIISVGTPYEWEIDFEDSNTGTLYSEYTSEYSGYNTSYAEFTYSITYNYWGMEYVFLDGEWDDGDVLDWDLAIGKNDDGDVIVLGKDSNEDYIFREKNSSITEKPTYTNIYLKYIWFVLIIVACIINIMNIWNIFAIKRSHKKEEQRKIIEAERNKIENKKQLLRKKWKDEMNALGYTTENSITVSQGNCLWIANNKLYEAENSSSFVNTYLDKEIESSIINYSCIDISNIQCFSKEGDVQYTTKISGGGGGGSSITGAIVGGLLAGEAGAIIGSRKKVNDVKSESVTHDNRKTLIRYYREKALLNISYAGFSVYDYLLKKIPEKDLLSMQLKGNIPLVERREENVNTVEEKMKMIKNLYEQGLISKEEYESKKSDLLMKI